MLGVWRIRPMLVMLLFLCVSCSETGSTFFNADDVGDYPIDGVCNISKGAQYYNEFARSDSDQKLECAIQMLKGYNLGTEGYQSLQAAYEVIANSMDKRGVLRSSIEGDEVCVDAGLQGKLLSVLIRFKEVGVEVPSSLLELVAKTLGLKHSGSETGVAREQWDEGDWYQSCGETGYHLDTHLYSLAGFSEYCMGYGNSSLCGNLTAIHEYFKDRISSFVGEDLLVNCILGVDCRESAVKHVETLRFIEKFCELSGNEEYCDLGVDLNAKYQTYRELLNIKYFRHFDLSGAPLSSSGVPVVSSDSGYRINPVSVIQYGLGYYDDCIEECTEEMKSAIKNAADWIVNENVSGWLLNYYSYRLHGTYEVLLSPFVSAMDQGMAISFMLRAYALFEDPKYYEVANELLSTFYTERQEYGRWIAALDESDDLWFEEYPVEGGLAKTLNGFIFALIGLYEKAEHDNDSRARYLFEEGMKTLENNIMKYDSGDIMYYCLKHKVKSLGYHKVVLSQLEYLADKLGYDWIYDAIAHYEMRLSQVEQ
jgi:hypothetical protein